MAIQYLDHHAELEGVVSAEDAEDLARWLQDRHAPVVRLGGCTQLHAAALQVLLALGPRVGVAPADPWLAAALGVDPVAAA